MKLFKKSLFLIALFIFFNIYITVAIAGNIENDYFFERGTNISLNNVRGLVYVCKDDNCNEVDLTNNGRFDQNSGNTNKISIEFLGTRNPTRYAEYFYKKGYLPLETTVSDYGTGHEVSYDNHFGKLNYCSSHIDNFYVVNEVRPNEPLQIDVQASLGADTYSAFSRPNKRPYFIPPDQSIRDEYYSAKTQLNLRIINQDNRLVFEQNKLLNLYLDEKESVQFSWTPTIPGRYRAELISTVTDDQCNQENDIPQQVAKEFKVLEDQSNLSCYTLLNQITFSDPHPVENQPIKIFVEKISNFRDNNQRLYPVQTDTRLRIFKDGNLVHEETKILPANQNPDQSTEHEYNWTTPSDGLFNIIIDGEAEDPRCNNIENISDHIETNLLVKKSNVNPQFDLDILPINDLSIFENTNAQFTVNVNYNGNRNLIYNIEELPNGANFENNVFSWTPDYDTITHNNIFNQLRNIIGIPLKKDFELEFKVTDGVLADTEKVIITVIDKNRKPEISNVRDIEVTEGDPINANKIFIFSDPDNDTLKITYTAPLNNNGEWLTKVGDAGLYNIQVRAEDKFNGNDKETFRIIVHELAQNNNAPILDYISDKRVKEGNSLIFSINAKDPDNDKLYFRVNIDPRAIGATFNEETKVFTWHTRKGQKGTYEVEFFVTDGSHEDSQIVKIYVFDEELQVDLENSESHKFSVSSLIIENTEVKQGNNLEVFVRVRNYGTVQDKVTLRLEIKELGIRETKTFSIDAKTGKLKVFSILIPKDSPKGNYILEAKAFNNYWHSTRNAEFSII
ncbi:hypothetical protein J4455_02500 [Candidatus Woesearchaeota archaeon]|nr:hypothetical protein [Candidatus Woesearchaeota archaeon]